MINMNIINLKITEVFGAPLNFIPCGEYLNHLTLDFSPDEKWFTKGQK